MARGVRKPRSISELGIPELTTTFDRATGVTLTEAKPLGNEGVQWLITEIKKKVCQKDAIFSLSMMANLAAMQPDGRYHTARFNTGDEFAFTGLRIGKRDQLIFEFKPIDPAHKQVEANEDKVFGYFPNLQEQVVAALGFDYQGDKLVARAEDRGNIEMFASAKWRWIREETARRAEKKKVEVKAKKIESVSRAEDDPMWGIF